VRNFKVMAAVATVLTAVVVAGCGGGDSSNNSSKSGASAENGKLSGSISVWIMDPGSPKIQGVVKQYATDFQAKNPGTTVNIEFVPWAQAHDKFVTAIAGGKVPDVAEMGTTWTPEFADQGGLVEQPKFAAGDYVSSLVDAATLNGKVYGKPWYAGARALIYRKDILKKAGIASPPATWDEMMAAAKTIKAKVPGVFAVSYTGLSEHMYLPTIWQAGGQIATQNGDTWKSALNTPEAAKALEYYASFYKDGLDPKAAVGWEEPDAQTAFVNGDVAMLIAGGWTYNSILATKPKLESKIGTALEPAGPSGKDTAFAGGSHLVQFQESKNKALGAAFIDFMLKPAELNKFTSAVGFLPGTTEGIKSSGYLEDAQRKPFAEQLLDHSAVYPPSPK
jgi:N,N'-diacetylchitobiose transport system substrate-binding protein